MVGTTRRSTILCLATLLAAIPNLSPSEAGVLLIPPGLKPGDQYQLAFVTDANNLSEARNAASPNINDYNTYVQGLADAAGIGTLNGQPITWTVIGSTQAVSALSNAPQSADIYDLEGHLIATNGNLYSGSLSNPIDVTEYGTSYVASVWTGTDPGGGSDLLFPLGGTPGAGRTVIGFASQTDITFLDRDPSDSFSASGSNGNLAGLYALSAPLTVTAAVPEPASLTLCLTGVAACAIATRWRRSHVRVDGPPARSEQ